MTTCPSKPRTLYASERDPKCLFLGHHPIPLPLFGPDHFKIITHVTRIERAHNVFMVAIDPEMETELTHRDALLGIEDPANRVIDYPSVLLGPQHQASTPLLIAYSTPGKPPRRIDLRDRTRRFPHDDWNVLGDCIVAKLLTPVPRDPDRTRPADIAYPGDTYKLTRSGWALNQAIEHELAAGRRHWEMMRIDPIAAATPPALHLVGAPPGVPSPH